MSKTVTSRVYNQLYPSDGVMLPAEQRTEVVDGLVREEMHELVGAPTVELLSDASHIRDMGMYCLRSVYLDLAQSSNSSVRRSSVTEAFDDLMALGDLFIKHAKTLNRTLGPSHRGNIVGALSELGIIGTILGGITDGHYGEGFAVLAAQRNSRRPGLRNDVDVRARVDNRPLRLQIKTGHSRQDWVYERGIKVIAVNSLADTRVGRRRSARQKLTNSNKEIATMQVQQNLLSFMATKPEKREQIYNRFKELIN